MFDWLFEGGITVFVLLFIAGAILLLLWWQWRTRRLLIGVGVVAALAAVYAALDAIVETRHEQLVRTINEMEQAFRRGDLNEFFRLTADDFQAMGMNKAQMRAEVEAAIRQFEIRNAQVRHVEVRQLDRDNGTAMVRFSGSADNNRNFTLPIPCEADFAFKGGEWKVKTIRMYRPGLNNPEWNPFRER